MVPEHSQQLTTKLRLLKIRRSILPSRFFRFTRVLSKMDIHLIKRLIKRLTQDGGWLQIFDYNKWIHRDFTESRIKIVQPTFFGQTPFNLSIFRFEEKWWNLTSAKKNLTIWRHSDVRLPHRVNQIMPRCWKWWIHYHRLLVHYSV